MAKPASNGISALTPSALDHPSARDARTLIRSAVKAALATSDHQNGHPYASLILAGTTFEGAPVTLISDLAVHTRNIKQRPQVSMLFDGTADNGDPMAGGRVSVSGTMEPIADPDEREAASVRF
ncbi:MAG: pyridoxamine 5'-phosphate oxidase family protein, partial [Pseudomonadota bacterium]